MLRKRAAKTATEESIETAIDMAFWRVFGIWFRAPTFPGAQHAITETPAPPEPVPAPAPEPTNVVQMVRPKKQRPYCARNQTGPKGVQLEDIRRCAAIGMTVGETARALGCTSGNISQRRKRYDIPFRPVSKDTARVVKPILGQQAG